jgi:hypothetical protein
MEYTFEYICEIYVKSMLELSILILILVFVAEIET